jgi:hypothetical protein
MLANKKEHNESAPTTPHPQGFNLPCSIGHSDPTLHRPYPTTRTTTAATSTTTTTNSPRAPTIQQWRLVLDAYNQGTT